MVNVMMKIEFSVKEKTQISPDGFRMEYGASHQSEVDGRVGWVMGSSEVEHF